MLLLGLDIATYKSGWAVLNVGDGPLELVSYGLIDLPTKKSVKLGQRLHLFREHLQAIIVEHEPDRVVIEDAHIRFIKSAKSLLKTHGIALGIVWQLLQKEVSYIQPAKIRGILGCKDKTGARLAVNERFELELTEEQEDISDAIATAWAGYSAVRKGK